MARNCDRCRRYAGWYPGLAIRVLAVRANCGLGTGPSGLPVVPMRAHATVDVALRLPD